MLARNPIACTESSPNSDGLSRKYQVTSVLARVNFCRNATHSEWTGKSDGKAYPSTGNPNEDIRSVKHINDRTLHVVSKKDGKVVLTAHLVVALDGKSRTVTDATADTSSKASISFPLYELKLAAGGVNCNAALSNLEQQTGQPPKTNYLFR